MLTESSVMKFVQSESQEEMMDLPGTIHIFYSGLHRFPFLRFREGKASYLLQKLCFMY